MPYSFTPQTRLQLIWQLPIAPDRVEEFDDALKAIEETSSQLNVDYVAHITDKSNQLAAALNPPSGSTAASDNPLAPVLELQNQGVREFTTDELSVTFSGSTLYTQADSLRNYLLGYFSGMGYHFWGNSAIILRS